MFSKATEYALRACIYIAQKSSEENKLGIEEIAKAISSPKSFTAKILQKLTANNGIVKSVRGPSGGFYMSKKMQKRPVRDILHIMEEDELLGKCVLGLKKCSEHTPCPMHAEYKCIKEQLINLFENTSIEKLALDANIGNVFIKNK
ncbi:MAG: Rrf2 family transcriptional regulator [Sediminibacterium sp.]|nr:Rrf2 family transcriptional regulator [Sediminibacterium sp.]TXT33021.1 MAG: transcriptional regulator badm/rrf2 family [Chitinophagaceae bacterium]